MEKAPTERRTASAGWYRTGATDQYARQSEMAMTRLNADRFADETKTQVGDLLAEHYGPVDYLVRSVAAPRRRDPGTGHALSRSGDRPSRPTPLDSRRPGAAGAGHGPVRAQPAEAHERAHNALSLSVFVL